MVRRLLGSSVLALLPVAGCSLLVDAAGLDGAGGPREGAVDASLSNDAPATDAAVGELDAAASEVGGNADGGSPDGRAGDGGSREAGPTDSGPADSGPADSGLDAGLPVEGGSKDAAIGPSTPGEVACGAGWCSVSTNKFCCGDFSSPSANCVAASNTCVAKSELYCDEAPDCSLGASCCLAPDAYEPTVPSAECKAVCAGTDKATLCSSDFDCAVGVCEPIVCKGRVMATCRGVVPPVCL